MDILVLKNLISSVFFGSVHKEKTGVHCLGSMARVIGFHYGQTES